VFSLSSCKTQLYGQIYNVGLYCVSIVRAYSLRLLLLTTMVTDVFGV